MALQRVFHGLAVVLMHWRDAWFTMWPTHLHGPPACVSRFGGRTYASARRVVHDVPHVFAWPSSVCSMVWRSCLCNAVPGRVVRDVGNPEPSQQKSRGLSVLGRLFLRQFRSAEIACTLESQTVNSGNPIVQHVYFRSGTGINALEAPAGLLSETIQEQTYWRTNRADF